MWAKMKEKILGLLVNKWLTQTVSKLSWKFDGFKTEITALLVFVQMFANSSVCGEYCGFLQIAINKAYEAIGTSKEQAMSISVAALLGSIWHHLAKRFNK